MRNNSTEIFVCWRILMFKFSYKEKKPKDTFWSWILIATNFAKEFLYLPI